MKRQALFAAGVLSLGACVASAEGMVPFDVQVPLVLKALTYDRNLKARAGDHVRIAVVSPAKAARDTIEDLLASVGHLPDRTLSGMPVTFKEVVVTDDSSLDQVLRNGRWTAAYIMPGFRAEELEKIRRVCASRQVLAVAAEVDDMERGLTFSIGSAGGRPQIVVNVANAKASGTDFDLALLRLARVIQ